MNVMTLIAVALAGWMNRQQQDVIEYLREEVRVLRELQGKRRLRFTDEQRRCLARKVKRIRFARLEGDRGPSSCERTGKCWVRRISSP